MSDELKIGDKLVIVKQPSIYIMEGSEFLVILHREYESWGVAMFRHYGKDIGGAYQCELTTEEILRNTTERSSIFERGSKAKNN